MYYLHQPDQPTNGVGALFFRYFKPKKNQCPPITTYIFFYKKIYWLLKNKNRDLLTIP